MPFDPPQDWTKYGIKTLTIWFQGQSANTATQMYVKINDTKVLYEGDAENLMQKPWQLWRIDLTELTGANLTSVTKLTIGFENGGKGTLYIDDITLSPVSQESVVPVEPDSTGLLAHYAFEGDAGDATVVGGAHIRRRSDAARRSCSTALTITSGSIVILT